MLATAEGSCDRFEPINLQNVFFSETNKVRNSGLGPDPDQSAKNGPDFGTRSGFVIEMPQL